ncbi:N5,N10-methylene tetrahydromethanopterin reductase [Mycobacterium saskatchewanense]|uniref:5,10-methylene tetrahydromethanopterin reductase n=1 Tax=Mycobacterium saskatchewanense TaxID=220927 RepID=A0AAJ3NSW1_9MYCO|nr:LLM class flavin-dependent oxidoreductase [Mycobacterium saskatchewanense]ORW72939.1 5,10-methylene tetrahydromethanopterin reductase [Mycobacterium saskatchewanense]BBX62528.1 N5,N10-methylene tetrahydromethanopterin reductase [Mycobacterium saskatchewanense]
MTDYGHPLVFGTLLEPPPGRPLEVTRLAEVTERAELDLVSLSDHPYWPDRLDTFALLAAICAVTDRVRVLSNLANLPLRPPVMLARNATTLDLLSGGRFELGIGAGAQQMWDAIVAEGGPRRGPGESVDALDEAIQIIRALWTQNEPVHFRGNHYHVDGATPGPRPSHDINVWLGAYQPRLLRMVGRRGDVWISSSPFLGPDQLSAANKIIDNAAVAARREPATVRRAYNIAGEFTAAQGGFLHGPPAKWAEQLTDVALAEGVSVFILFRVESADVIERFAAEVVPEVREQVGAERSD